MMIKILDLFSIILYINNRIDEPIYVIGRPDTPCRMASLPMSIVIRSALSKRRVGNEKGIREIKK